jgi:hypothetical protein
MRAEIEALKDRLLLSASSEQQQTRSHSQVGILTMCVLFCVVIILYFYILDCTTVHTITAIQHKQ